MSKISRTIWVIGGIVVIVLGCSNFSIKLNHFKHFFLPPKDLYQPIILDRFTLHEKDYSKTYVLKPKYRDFYEIGVESDDGLIPKNLRFAGRLRFTFYNQNKKILEQEATSIKASIYNIKDSNYFKSIIFSKFPLPIKLGFLNETLLTITVIEPDKKYDLFKDKLKLFVRVSSVP